jgi:hypothetical protein
MKRSRRIPATRARAGRQVGMKPLLLALALTAVTAFTALTPLTAHADTPKLDGKLDGTWCEPNREVGCYTFKGKAVVEEALSNSRASKGSWMQDEDMLILTFKEGPWSLQIVKATARVLVLKDLSRRLTYTFTRR